MNNERYKEKIYINKVKRFIASDSFGFIGAGNALDKYFNFLLI